MTLAGFALLFGGADVMVRSSVSLGLIFGLPPLVIGLTIVAFSTSAPEVIVSLAAALQDQGDIALGNVFGSNLANIGLILGISALVTPMAVQMRSVRLDGPVMIATGLLSGWMAWDGRLGRVEALGLLVLLIVLIVMRLKIERADPSELPEEVNPSNRWSLGKSLGGLTAGILLLAFGGDLLVEGAVGLATRLAIPQAFIAITVVAVGTSLPELSTSLIAAFRGKADIAVGNVLGSNIFNSCAVLGIAGVAKPLSSSSLFHEEIITTSLLSLLLLPLLWTGRRIERWEGGLLLALYAGIIIYIGGK